MLFQVHGVEGKQTTTEQLLNEKLKPYNLSFLAKDLAGVKNIIQIIDGMIGKDMLAELARMFTSKKIGANEAEKKALKAFTVLSALHTDFNEKYAELKDKSDKSGSKMSKLEMTTRAFSYAMEKNNIRYKSESSLLNGLNCGLIDCDTSSYVFIQFASSKGLDLVGVSLPKHYVVGHRENGKIVSYVETTKLLKGYDNDIVAKYNDQIKELKDIKKSVLDKISNDPTLKSKYEEILNDINNTLADIKNTLADKTGIVDAKTWKNDPKNANPVISERPLTYQSLRWEMERFISMMERTTPITKQLQSEFGFFKHVDRKKYREAEAIMKKNWETKHDSESFRDYYGFLEMTSNGAWLAKVDNEKELFSLVAEGKRILGKKEVDKVIDNSFLVMKKITNPIDWFAY